jgi:dihydrofolate reductase
VEPAVRRVVGSLFQSLDGVIQAPGGPEEDPTGFTQGGWVYPYFDDSLDEPMGRLLGGDYELLLGRRTYEIFAAYWPHNGDQPIGATFNTVRKHVVTSSDRPLTWNNSHRLAGDPAAAVARLKATDGPDLLIQGSSRLYDALLPAGLVDTLTLITYPVMLGHGKRWYSGNAATARSWTLVEQAHSPLGVHFATYARDGEVRTGTFATKPPSDDELALRRRQAEGRW